MIEFYTDNARLINFVLLIAVIAGFTTVILTRRRKATRRVRRVMMWVYLIFINFAYGTADNLRDGIRVNPPVVVATFLLAGLLVSLAWRPDGDDKLPPDDGSVGSRFIEWVDSHVRAYKARRDGAVSSVPRVHRVRRAIYGPRGR